MIHKLTLGIMVGLGTVMASAAVTSDYPPWAGIHRVDRSEARQIEDEIGNIWFQEYCPAERNHTTIAEIAAEQHINRLESEYQAISGASSIPLLPCP